MISAPPHALRLRALLRSLRRGLDADLAGIRLLFVPRLPVDGLACGDVVALSSHLLEAGPRALLHAAVHELVHVFQQRAGRVTPQVSAGSFAFNLDPSLEAEAEQAARFVVNGGRIALHAPGRLAPSTAVIQPLLVVGGQVLTDAKALSARFTRLLGLIPQGPAWLEWALRSPGTATPFAGESELLAAIQLGLHGTADVCFQSAGLRLAPTLLLPVDDPDFGNVVGSLETGQLTPAALTALRTMQVRTERDFAALDTVFANLGVSAALPLASPTLAEQVALQAQFAGQPAGESTAALAAAQFAAAHAQTATDFAAAFSFHLAIAPDDTPPSVPPAQVWTQLGSLAFPYLQCPTCDPLMTDEGLAAFIASHLRRAGLIGFPSQAVAIAAIGANAGLSLGQPLDDNAPDRIRTCLLDLAKLVVPQPGGPPARPVITLLQDGLTRWIDYAGAGGSARFQLDPSGLLTLRRFTSDSAS